MNKNVIYIIIALIVIIGAAIGLTIYANNKNDTSNDQNVNEISNEKNSNSENSVIYSNNNNNVENQVKSGNKILVVYFSAQSHTKAVAEKIANNLNTNIFEVVPEEEYTNADLDWTNSNSRVSKEHENESLRDIKLKSTKVENWQDYDTVLVRIPDLVGHPSMGNK